MSTPAPTRPDTARLDDLAVQLLNAVLDSADVDTIGMTNWWGRARSALEVGAAGAVDWPSMVSAACKRMQIGGALRPESAATVAELGMLVAKDPAILPALRDHCRRNAIYITALARIVRNSRADERKTARAAKPTITAPVAAEEILF